MEATKKPKKWTPKLASKVTGLVWERKPDDPDKLRCTYKGLVIELWVNDLSSHVDVCLVDTDEHLNGHESYMRDEDVREKVSNVLNSYAWWKKGREALK